MTHPLLDMLREKNDIAKAANEITSLWWANPQENGHIKTEIVEAIIRKHLWGFTGPAGVPK